MVAHKSEKSEKSAIAVFVGISHWWKSEMSALRTWMAIIENSRPMVAQKSEKSETSAVAVFAGMLLCWKSEMSAIAVFLASWWIVLKKCQK